MILMENVYVPAGTTSFVTMTKILLLEPATSLKLLFEIVTKNDALSSIGDPSLDIMLIVNKYEPAPNMSFTSYLVAFKMYPAELMSESNTKIRFHQKLQNGKELENSITFKYIYVHISPITHTVHSVSYTHLTLPTNREV